MSLSLMDALAEVDLAPGQTYWCVVKGCRVELQVFPESSPAPWAPTADGEVPLDDPFEHPFPEPARRTNVSLGTLPLPEPLELSPEDYEEPSGRTREPKKRFAAKATGRYSTCLSNASPSITCDAA